MRKILFLLVILMMSVSTVSALTYDQMMRYPDQNIGVETTLSGQVIETFYFDDAWDLRICTKKNNNSNNFNENDILVTFFSESPNPRILVNDFVQITGTFQLLFTYNSSSGEQRTIPALIGKTYEIIDLSYFNDDSNQKQTTITVQTDTVTTGERNAAKKALTYLDYTAFSRSGLIEQLEFEGFTKSEAVYGVDQSGADWNEQAAKKAESYLDLMAFSRSGLIEQLEFEGFTHSQAVYGVNSVGY